MNTQYLGKPQPKSFNNEYPLDFVTGESLIGYIKGMEVVEVYLKVLFEKYHRQLQLKILE
jgi:hypothetical protein